MIKEKEIERIFVEFLTKDKGYSTGNLLFNAPLVDYVSSKGVFKTYMADLLLLDTDFNNYLALIEFKNGTQHIPIDIIDEFQRYKTVLGKSNLLVYLVVGSVKDTEEDFNIYVIDNDKLKIIDKADFPHYETLKSKNKADEKKEFKELSIEKESLYRKRKDFFKSTAWSTLASLIVGLLVALFFSKNVFFDSNFDKVELKNEIQHLKKDINLKISGTKDSISNSYFSKKDLLNESKYVQKKDLIDLQKRLSSIEDLINQSPGRLLKIQEVNFQIQSLKTEIEYIKELNETKLVGFKERIDQLTLWITGLIITIFGSIIGLIINAFRKT